MHFIKREQILHYIHAAVYSTRHTIRSRLCALQILQLASLLHIAAIENYFNNFIARQSAQSNEIWAKHLK